MGSRVAVIGAGGIGYDVSEFLTHVGEVGLIDDCMCSLNDAN